METLIGVFIGIALSAACGFRVFVPLFVLGIAGRVGHVPLAGDFHWITSTVALIALGTATVVEIVAYYVPWLDHALDTIATCLLSVAESRVTRPKLMVRPSRTTRASASTSDAETARMKCVVWSTVVIGR